MAVLLLQKSLICLPFIPLHWRLTLSIALSPMHTLGGATLHMPLYWPVDRSDCCHSLHPRSVPEASILDPFWHINLRPIGELNSQLHKC